MTLLLVHASAAAAAGAIGIVGTGTEFGHLKATYTGVTGAEHLVVSAPPSGGAAIFKDVAGGTLYSADPRCSGSGSHAVTCVGPFEFFAVDAGLGNDMVDTRGWQPLNDAFSTVAGGAGSDLILGHAGHDSLDGGDGADVLYGGDGSDALVGGRGSDWLYGGAGYDGIDARDGIAVWQLYVDHVDCGPSDPASGNAAVNPNDVVVNC